MEREVELEHRAVEASTALARIQVLWPSKAFLVLTARDKLAFPFGLLESSLSELFCCT